MRKTYANPLASNDVPLDAIRELLEHTGLSTALNYIYNPLPENDTYELLARHFKLVYNNPYTQKKLGSLDFSILPKHSRRARDGIQS